jgi:hypothetical protein
VPEADFHKLYLDFKLEDELVQQEEQQYHRE